MSIVAGSSQENFNDAGIQFWLPSKGPATSSPTGAGKRYRTHANYKPKQASRRKPRSWISVYWI